MIARWKSFRIQTFIQLVFLCAVTKTQDNKIFWIKYKHERRIVEMKKTVCKGKLDSIQFNSNLLFGLIIINLINRVWLYKSPGSNTKKYP